MMSLASEAGHAVVNERLFIPKEWTIARMKEAGVPKKYRKQIKRHQHILDMLKEQREFLEHGWVCGDDEIGRPAWFRKALNDIEERYLLAVPGNTTVRDLEIVLEYQGRGTPERCRSSVSRSGWTSSRNPSGNMLSYEMVRRGHWRST